MTTVNRITGTVAVAHVVKLKCTAGGPLIKGFEKSFVPTCLMSPFNPHQRGDIPPLSVAAVQSGCCAKWCVCLLADLPGSCVGY